MSSQENLADDNAVWRPGASRIITKDARGAVIFGHMTATFAFERKAENKKDWEDVVSQLNKA